ncbi:plasmalemma vesicle associated protein a [Scomber scombrus]|uniref:Plasmalemma vesicle associated protein a n=1 Tax=Scomber scombrus TaxID=13677 RepID=A0AAV1MYX0_SCOSC|nr:plasmalemma vesicle associated protein a [Scomber scombrus]
MYSSGYSQVSKYSSGAQKKMQYRSKGKSCGYYMRIVFFFSSLIQSLIIVSLVLFLVYGKKQDSASSSRIQDLEESFSRLSIENVALRQQRKNLTNLLNATTTAKTRVDWDLKRMKEIANMSYIFMTDLSNKHTHCETSLNMCKATVGSGACTNLRTVPHNCNCGLIQERMSARILLVESNFTQTVGRMRQEMEQIAKDRDTLNLEVILLRRDKSTHENELQMFKQKCKGDFIKSLNGIPNVTSAFLKKIESLFPLHIAFQLTCQHQREHLEQIRSNCTSLSRDVSTTFQRYLDSLGTEVTDIRANCSRFMAENGRLYQDYRTCSLNRTSLIKEHKQNLQKLQLEYDSEKEKLLRDKMTLNGEIDVMKRSIIYKTTEVEHLKEQLRQLNMSCMSKQGQTSQSWNMFNTGGSSSLGQPSRTGTGIGLSYGSIGSGLNKPVSTGLGSSSYGSTGSNPSLSSYGTGFNKPASTGLGSSSYGSAGSIPSLSSVGSGVNKPASTGLGSSSFGSTGLNPISSLNKPATSGRNTPTFGSTGSSPNLSSGGSGLNKPASTGLGSSSFGSVGSSPNLSSGGIGSNKPTSNAKPSTSWFGNAGLGSSNTGQTKPGSGTGRGTSGGTGTSYGAGRTSGLGGGSAFTQHLQDLQRIINPQGPQEKQGLSRVMG